MLCGTHPELPVSRLELNEFNDIRRLLLNDGNGAKRQDFLQLLLFSLGGAAVK